MGDPDAYCRGDGMVQQRRDENAEDDGHGIAIASRQYQGQYAGVTTPRYTNDWYTTTSPPGIYAPTTTVGAMLYQTGPNQAGPIMHPDNIAADKNRLAGSFSMLRAAQGKVDETTRLEEERALKSIKESLGR